MSPLDLEGYLAAADLVTESFLGKVYPALAAAISPALYYVAVLYWASLGYKIYGGYAALEWRDVLAKTIMTCAVFSSLSWSGFASQLYGMFVSLMESAAGTILAGQPAASLLAALFINADQISQTLRSSDIYQMNAIIEGSLILVLNCLLFTIALFYLTVSKLGLAVTMVLLPLFIGFAMFKETRCWFMNWLSKMFGFALIYILVITIVKLAFLAFGHYIEAVGEAAGYSEARKITSDMVTNLYVVEIVLILFISQVREWAAFLANGAAVQGGLMVSRVVNDVRGAG